MGNIPLTPNAEQVFNARYRRKNPDGTYAETIEGTFRRVANAVASAEENNKEEWADRFYDLMTRLDFLPNSPTFFGAGTPLGNLAACYVLNIEDEMGKGPEGIFSTLRTAVLIQQSGGGNGFSFSRLRPKGDPVHSSGGVASGPISFMKAYDAAFHSVSQGGARRSANMAVLEVSHPDIEEFITCKETENDITNFNISVGITDAFMEAVLADINWDLTFKGKVYKTLRARDLFDKIVSRAHFNGEPGVLFLDTANKDHPTPHLGRLEATNPCGEQYLLGYENCCLGSINLANHVKDGDIDWEKLMDTVILAARFLDDVIDANKYVEAVPELKAAAKLTRRIGLGIMGLADVFYKLKIRYGSEQSLELAKKIMEFITFYATMQSSLLAADRGVFEAFEGSIYDIEDYRWKAPQRPLNGHPAVDWELCDYLIRTNGIRNAAVTTVAPTGTLSTIAGLEGYGCEPVFALAYTRYMLDGEERKELEYVSPLFSKAIQECADQLEPIDYNQLKDIILSTGSCQLSKDLPGWVRHTFVVAADITPEEHVNMQAALQHYVSNAISKTCNFPATATIHDVAEAYILAWQSGCKGLTVYVEGSRDKVVLETAATKNKPVDEEVRGSLACPSCNNDLLQYTEGCVSCVCGYSACAV